MRRRVRDAGPCQEDMGCFGARAESITAAGEMRCQREVAGDEVPVCCETAQAACDRRDRKYRARDHCPVKQVQSPGRA
jgi:hypothetical protein